MNGFSHKLDETIVSVDQFQNDQWSGYNYLVKQLNDTTEEPFHQLFSSLQKMSAAAEKLKTYPLALTDLRIEFEDFVCDKDSIESGTAEWNTLKQIKEKYTMLVDGFNDLTDEANEMKQSVNDIENDCGIEKLTVSGMNSRIAALLSDIERRNAMLAEKNDPMFSETKRIFGEMKKLFKEITNEVGEKREIWVMPGSFVNVRLEEIKRKGKEVKEIIVAAYNR